MRGKICLPILCFGPFVNGSQRFGEDEITSLLFLGGCERGGEEDRKRGSIFERMSEWEMNWGLRREKGEGVKWEILRYATRLAFGVIFINCIESQNFCSSTSFEPQAPRQWQSEKVKKKKTRGEEGEEREAEWDGERGREDRFRMCCFLSILNEII